MSLQSRAPWAKEGTAEKKKRRLLRTGAVHSEHGATPRLRVTSQVECQDFFFLSLASSARNTACKPLRLSARQTHTPCLSAFAMLQCAAFSPSQPLRAVRLLEMGRCEVIRIVLAGPSPTRPLSTFMRRVLAGCHSSPYLGGEKPSLAMRSADPHRGF